MRKASKAIIFSFVCVLLSTTPAVAQVVWSTNYQGNWSLNAWDDVQCGATNNAFCPASSYWRSTGAGGWESRGVGTASPLGGCSAGSSCRFTLQSSAPDGAPGPFLRIETHGSTEGDQMWSGYRNETVWNAECNPQTGICDNLEGQDRYYAWKTFIPNNFPAITSSGANWHVLFQFHEIGNCSGNGPPLTFGLKNFESQAPYTKYKFVLSGKSAYGCDDDLPLWEDNAPLQTGVTHSFVLHTHYSSGNSGYYELWIDGAKKTDSRMLNRPTLYRWPSQELKGCASAGCDASWYPNVAGHVMSIYLKSGNYHTFNSAAMEVVYHSDVTVGKTCADVAPQICASAPASGGNGTDGPVWAKQEGTGQDDYAYGVSADPSGNAFVAGYTRGTLDYTSGGGLDAFVRKYDGSGNLIWGRQLGSGGDERAYAVVSDSAGNAFVAGSTTDALYQYYAGGAHDGFVAKYNASGGRLWIQNVGSPGDDVVYAAAADSAGNVFAVGSTTGALGYSNQGQTDAFIVKLDSQGNVLWKRQLGTPGNDSATGVSVDGSGNAYAVGSTEGNLGTGNSGGTDAFIAKFDSAGNRPWVVQFGSAGDDSASAIAADSNGNLFVTGSTTGDLAYTNQGGVDTFVAEYNSDGALVWSRQLGSPGDEWSVGIALGSSGELFVAGRNNAPLYTNTSGGFDAFLAKYSRSGDRLWIHHLGSSADDTAMSVSAGGGGAYVVGGTMGTLPGGSTKGAKDFFISKFRP